jgi:copper resistance protein D
LDFSLVLSRALHFAATALASGIIFFRIFVARPSTRDVQQQSLEDFYRQLRLIFWISLMLALASGVAWFILVAADIVDRPWSQTFTDDAAWTVLTETQFGHVCMSRLLLGALLAAIVGLAKMERNWCWPIEASLAAGFIGSLAWVGHAGGTIGRAGDFHLASDILHLIAVGAWVGGLLPFAFLLKTFRSQAGAGWVRMASAVTERFSTLGIAAVGTILVTGIINTWNLVGSADALFGTDYGRLLMLKVVLFATMVFVAAVNRLRLSPKLAIEGTIRKLERNSLIETGLGLIILFIVGALGTLAPALDSHAGHMN